jgi:hypothetical protein
MSEVAEAGMDAGGFPGGLCAVAGVLGSALHSGRIVARGLRGEPEDARVVDTGSAMSYFSYPESEHDAGISVNECAGGIESSGWYSFILSACVCVERNG